MKTNERKYHPLAFVAFILAILLFVLPTQADSVFVLLRLGEMWAALLVVVGSISLVVLPLLVAERATRLHREKRRKETGLSAQP